MIGDWRGSYYGIDGCRIDYRLFLDRDGRYEREVRREPNYLRVDAGCWFHDPVEGVLRLESNSPDDSDRKSPSWWVLSIQSCEDSNCILVLRWAGLASRNLPILFYRVHCDGRGYGTDWERELGKRDAAAVSAPG